MTDYMVRRQYGVYQGDPRMRVSLSFLDEDGNPLPCLTEQIHKKACDINNIIATYDRTGLVQHVNTAQARYGDFSEVTDYQGALNTVLAADEAFNSLPALIRKRFDNDPAAFLDFVSDSKNLDEMRELGLANPAPASDDDSGSDDTEPDPPPTE